MGIFEITKSPKTQGPKFPHFTGDEAIDILKIAEQLVKISAPEKQKKEIEEIWTGWRSILKSASQDKFTEGEIADLRKIINNWSALWVKHFGKKNVTPYVHFVGAHWCDLIQMHGNLKKFSQDGLEASHRLHNLIYGRSTNRSKGDPPAEEPKEPAVADGSGDADEHVANAAKDVHADVGSISERDAADADRDHDRDADGGDHPTDPQKKKKPRKSANQQIMEKLYRTILIEIDHKIDLKRDNVKTKRA